MLNTNMFAIHYNYADVGPCDELVSFDDGHDLLAYLAASMLEYSEKKEKQQEKLASTLKEFLGEMFFTRGSENYTVHINTHHELFESYRLYEESCHLEDVVVTNVGNMQLDEVKHNPKV